MPDISTLITAGSYIGSPIIGSHSGNLITEYFRESTANKKSIDIYLPKPTPGNGEWDGSFPPILLPKNMSMRDLLNAHIHYNVIAIDESTVAFSTNVNYVTENSTLTGINFSERTSRIFYNVCGPDSALYDYDPETGVFFPHFGRIIDNLATALDLEGDDGSLLFDKIYEYLTTEPTEDSEEDESEESDTPIEPVG